MDALMVIGIDPGVSHIGAVLLRRDRDGAWYYVFGQHLNSLEALTRWCSWVFLNYNSPTDLLQIKLVAIEEVAGILDIKVKSRKRNTNRMLECHGIARLLANLLSVPLLEVKPIRVLKLMTGFGQARAGEQKKIIGRAVESQVHNWPTGNVSEHIRDAAAIAIAGYRSGIPFIR